MVNKLVCLIVTYIFTFHITWATNFYFSAATGEDTRNSIQARNPDTPWKSLSKLNEVFGSLRPGDTVFFKRNEVFHGSIHLRSSGTRDRPIVISAYGEGPDPIISGWIDVADWDVYGGGIHEASADAFPHKINILLVNGQPQVSGRFPNAGYISFESNAAKAVEVKTEIIPKDFRDATVVVRKNHWILDRHPVVSIKENLIEYAGDSQYSPTSGFGLFFQDHLETLDTFGEWHHDVEGQKVFVHFGDTPPSKSQVRASGVDYLVTNAPRAQHIVLENLVFSGANRTGIHLVDAEAISLKKCVIEYSGENALTAMSVPSLTVADSKVFFAQNNGLFLRYGTPNAVIENNRIEKIHLFPGMGLNGDGNGIGIYCVSDDALISRNVLFEIGYSGIVFNGNRTIVAENYINSFCLVKNDGGGIYTYEGPANQSYEGRKIFNNIIVNGIGNTEGTINSSRFSKPQVEGVYIDDNASGIEIAYNSIANVRRNGLNLHNARNIVVKNNTFYNAQNLLSVSHDKLGQPIRDVQVLDNIFIASTASQKVLFLSSIKDDFDKMAHFSGNIYGYPEGGEFVFQVKSAGGDNAETSQSFNVNQWKHGPLRDINFKAIAFDTSKAAKHIQDEGRNNMPQGAFNITCIGRGCVLKGAGLGNGRYDVVISENMSDSGIKIDVGPIDAKSKYLLTLELSSADQLVGSLVLRRQGHPWTNISETYSFGIDASNQRVEKLFEFPEETEAGSILLTIENRHGAFTMENIVWAEVDVPLQTSPAHFYYNPTNNQKVVKLSGSYIDLEGQKAGSEFTLEPFSSKILLEDN